MCLKNLVKKVKKKKGLIITNTPKYTDEELISLFSDEKPTQANKKKQKKNTPIIHKQLEIEPIDSSTSDILINEPEIEPIDSPTSDTLIDESELEPVDSQTSNTTYTSSSDEKQTTESLFKLYEVSFNCNISSSEKKNISKMVYELYKTNTNFYELMSNYTNLNITKCIHNDRIKKFKHFTGNLYNNYTCIKSSSYHFYIRYDKIYSITEIKNIL